MKTLLALLISCLTLSAATTYPGGVTNVFFLNSNVVTTGTMRATGALTLTNSGNVFAGDGSGLTGISAGVSTSGGSATNLSVYSSGTTNQPLRVWLGTQTNSNPIEASGIWNNAAINFTGIKLNFTNTSSGSGAKLADFQTDGTSQFAFYKNGNFGIRTASWGEFLFTLHDTYGFGLKAPDANWVFAAQSDGGLAALNLWAASSGRIGFKNTTFFTGATWQNQSIALERISDEQLKVTQSAGSLGDIVSRSVYATNLYATNLIINGGATVTKILSATATLNFDLTALTVEDLTITVTGAADGDVVTLGVPNGSITTSVQYSAWVSAADTVTVRARTSATGEDPASGTFRATVIKH
jgi:hypothetical protein